MNGKEFERLKLLENGKANWRKWGTYLSERQWGTVREDYSPDGTAWDYFPHDHARSRAYRWGEDGIAGWSDDQQQLCFSPAFWNGRDPIIKERLFGLNSSEGNHGEDVKELYYYLDNTPTHSYARYLYKYPHLAFPYDELLQGNRERSNHSPEFELLDTGVLRDNRYFNIEIEYAKADPETTCIRITITNMGDTAEDMYVLPTLWFRNGWDFGIGNKPEISLQQTTDTYTILKATKTDFGSYYLYAGQPENLLFTENETNRERLYGIAMDGTRTKDSFHRALIQQDFSALEMPNSGTKCAPLYRFTLMEGESREIRLLLSDRLLPDHPLADFFTETFKSRREEAAQFYANLIPEKCDAEEKLIVRQALSGLLWNKQYYNYQISRWLQGDPGQPEPPPQRYQGRNNAWQNVAAADIISMPDSWEFPWFASWDTAFQAVVMAMIDMDFAKQQLLLFTEDRYQREDGAIPAYEWSFGDLNPPLRAWAAIMIFDMGHQKDLSFLKQLFPRLQKNYNWWKTNEDAGGNDIFSGGFLGLDNISLFNRSQTLPDGEQLEQVDATAWVAMFALNMMKMCLLLREESPEFESHAMAYFDDFVQITRAVNHYGHQPEGLWDASAGFFFDCLKMPDGEHVPLTVKSIVGLTAIFPVCFLENQLLHKNKKFWQHVLQTKEALIDQQQLCAIEGTDQEGDVLISLIHRDKLEVMLKSILDPGQFLSPFGIRSLSRAYEDAFCMILNGTELCIDYQAGESQTGLFGGNSNWRGPIWMPINFLLICALQEYERFFDGAFQLDFPTNTQNKVSLSQLNKQLMEGIIDIFKKDTEGNRPVHGRQDFYRKPENEDLILFYEYFHGNTGRGCGASHQTGWSALVALLIQQLRTKTDH